MEKFQFDWEKELTPILRGKSLHDSIMERIEKMDTKRRIFRRFTPMVGCVGAVALVFGIFLSQKEKISDFITGSGLTGVIEGKSKQPVTDANETMTAKNPSTIDTNDNPVKLDVPGTIEHMVWKHNGGDIDETWRNTKTGEERYVKKFMGWEDGNQYTFTENGILTKGYLYLWSYRGEVLLRAEKIKQPNYVGRQTIFYSKWEEGKAAVPNTIKTGETTYQGIPVEIYEAFQAKDELHRIEEHTTVYYVDKIYHLILKRTTKPSKSDAKHPEQTDTYSYEYLQSVDEDFFKVPSHITFEERS